MKKKLNQGNPFSDSSLWYAVAIVCMLWLCYWSWIEFYFPDKSDLTVSQEIRGQFGDMFGAFNALFSALAFAVLVYTVRLQNREISEQFENQSRIMKSQLVRDQFDFYWRSYDPITADHISDFKIDHGEYMDEELYIGKYKGNDQLIRRYIHISQLYEILAFSLLIERANEGEGYNLLGMDWINAYCRRLAKDEVFRDIHQQYKGFYKEFEDFIDTNFPSEVIGKSKP
jgi:hypothetical protein